MSGKTRVHELAKELGIENKELIEKINGMGIEATSHMSGLNEMDVISIKNSMNKNNMKSETKIVKATPKKKEKEVRT